MTDAELIELYEICPLLAVIEAKEQGLNIDDLLAYTEREP